MPFADRLRVRAAFRDYSGDHRTRGNRLCHAVGIPLIVFGLLGLLAYAGTRAPIGGELLPALAAPRWELGFALWLFSALYYLRLDLRLGAPFSLCTYGVYLFAREVPFAAHAAAFVVGWVFQLVGHGRYEHRKPAFLRSLPHIFVGPLWMFAHAVRDSGAVVDDVPAAG